MKIRELETYICPRTQCPLQIKKVDLQEGEEIITGVLVSNSGWEYSIIKGIPDLTYPPVLEVQDEKVRSFYDERSDVYDKNLHMTFMTHNEDEIQVRNRFIDALELNPGKRVLEVACGTGRDSELIAQRLGSSGHLCLGDISSKMMSHCQERLSEVSVPVSFALSNAGYLPYPDRYFDAVYSFGGLGEFTDIRRSLAEMVRVSKIGAKIVVGDESIPPWLRETEFSNILVTTNKQFLAKVPLEEMPVDAREVCLRWVIGGVFYLIEFRVGDGEPQGNFDFEIPGQRGGTLRTRYHGQLESVTPETKHLAYKAREKRGISMHKWLEETVRQAAIRDLDEENKS